MTGLLVGLVVALAIIAFVLNRELGDAEAASQEAFDEADGLLLLAIDYMERERRADQRAAVWRASCGFQTERRRAAEGSIVLLLNAIIERDREIARLQGIIADGDDWFEQAAALMSDPSVTVGNNTSTGETTP